MKPESRYRKKLSARERNVTFFYVDGKASASFYGDGWVTRVEQTYVPWSVGAVSIAFSSFLFGGG